MKAVVFEQYGEPEVLQIAEIKKPIPGMNEVLVKIYATTVTAEDPKMRAFAHPPLLKIPVGIMFGFRKPKKPVLGIEFSGIVESVGVDVSLYKPGDRVFGYTGLGFGAYAEYICLSEDALMYYKPENLSFEESASLVNGYLSALVYLQKKAGISKGYDVLIYGASGSVGTAAVQLAKYFGSSVTGVCSTRNLKLVEAIGADRVIDYTRDDYRAGDRKYDIIFDTVGKTSIKDCLGMLKVNGKYLLTEFQPEHILATLFTSVFRNKKVIVAASNFYWKREDLIFLKKAVEKGSFKPIVDRTFTLEEMVEAHKYVETRHKVGNVAITVNSC